jgi:acylphosphatase
MSKTSIIVEGWIQSVGFRSFVKRVAAQLGLKGLVRNLPDGMKSFVKVPPLKLTLF